jgi:hypothetical protein
MKSKILIVGGGELGSRYLQGLARVSLPLDIFISDISNDSLATAEERWNEVTGTTNHNLQLGIGLSHVPQKVDVAIIATSADVRAQVVGSLSKHCRVCYWILEKVLAQSLDGIDEIQVVVKNTNAWVNTVRRSIPWHKEIKTKLVKSGPFSLSVEGNNWGLASNAIHFIDMLAWLGDETLVSIDTQQLNDVWLESSRRLGFWETFGTITAQFSSGSVVNLTCHNENQTNKSYTIRVRSGQDEWIIDESSGIAQNSAGLIVQGKLSHQSEITAPLIESILKTGQCELPLLNESAELHRPLIKGFLKHWNRNMSNSVTCVPIT